MRLWPVEIYVIFETLKILKFKPINWLVFEKNNHGGWNRGRFFKNKMLNKPFKLFFYVLYIDLVL